MYLTVEEFERFSRSAKALAGGEPNRPQLEEAIALGSAALDTLLRTRYATPLNLSDLSAGHAAIVKRWCKYLALEQLLAMQGLAVEREVRSALLDVIQSVREEIETFVNTAAQLEGAPTIQRIEWGVSDAGD